MQSILLVFSRAVCHLSLDEIHIRNSTVVAYSCQPFPADLDVSGIENLRLQKENHLKNIEGMREAIKTLHRKQRQLEDEEASIHKQKVRSIYFH